jgi:hypothetical protein
MAIDESSPGRWNVQITRRENVQFLCNRPYAYENSEEIKLAFFSASRITCRSSGGHPNQWHLPIRCSGC